MNELYLVGATCISDFTNSKHGHECGKETTVGAVLGPGQASKRKWKPPLDQN